MHFPFLDLFATLRQRFFALTDDRRGVAAVEFAMILPLMVTLYLGGVETLQGISIDRKVTLTARAVADLVAQKRGSDIITSGELDEIMKAAKAVASPYADNNLKVVVSSVKIGADKVAKVDWSKSTANAAPRATGEAVPLPAHLTTDPEKQPSVIWAEVSYDYTPIIGYMMTGMITLRDHIYMRPRVYEVICLNSCS